jgi:peroxiredoxin Q/BCP
MAIEEGKKAPPFTLADSEGKKVALGDFTGKNVILYFYPRDNTPGCTMEAEGFRRLWQKLIDRGAVVLGVSPDSPASHAEFACQYDLPFTLLSDPDKRVMTKYGAFGEKVTYGKKTTGVIRSTVWIGPDGKVVKHWPRVTDAGGHPARVLAELAEAEATGGMG